MVYVLLVFVAIGVYYLIYKAKCKIAEEKADNDIARLKSIQKRFNLSNYHMRRMAERFPKYKSYHDRFINKSKGVDIDRINEVIYWDYSEDYAWDLFYNNVSLEDKIGFRWNQIPMNEVLIREACCHPSDLYRKVKINEIRYVLDKEGLYPIPENGVQHRITQGGDMGTEVFQNYIYNYCKEHSILEDKNKEPE